MISAVTVLLFAVVIGTLYVLVARADGPGPGRSPGGVAYSVTMGVIGILAGGTMVVSGIWLLLMAIAVPGLFFWNAAGPAQAVLGALAVIVILSGALIFRVARQRLRQL